MLTNTSVFAKSFILIFNRFISTTLLNYFLGWCFALFHYLTYCDLLECKLQNKMTYYLDFEEKENTKVWITQK